MVETTLSLVKARLGISSSVRDVYINEIIKGVVTELEDEKGLVLDDTNSYQLMFVVDYATWRYQSVNDDGKYGASMPRHLQFRLHNIMIHGGANNENI